MFIIEGMQTGRHVYYAAPLEFCPLHHKPQSKKMRCKFTFFLQ